MSVHYCPHIWAQMSTGSGTAVLTNARVQCTICGSLAQHPLLDEYPAVQVDPEVHAAYVALTPAQVVRTAVLDERIRVDLDCLGNAVGIEILGYDQ
jgi:uncharacterized protein YuzE